jgi:t-SNARE complex subunit (syntaxin)
MSQLTRKEKEARYILSESKLQRHWGNTVEDGELDYIKQMSDEELDRAIKNSKGQLRFEYVYYVITFIAVIVIVQLVFGVFRK